MSIERKNSVGATNYAKSTTVNSNGFSGNSGKFVENPAITQAHNIFRALANTDRATKQYGYVPVAARGLDVVAQKADDLLYGKDSTGAEKLINDVSSPNFSSAGYASGLSSGYGYGGSAAGSIGAAEQAKDPFDEYMKLVRETTDKNNQWAAEQAQKQMDFQKEMSDTAHQREVKDLLAAGLNPVLSANGGSGASSPSGAMATPDTSNTRLLAEAAMQQLTAIGGTAVQLATSSGGRGRAANNFRNSLIGIAQKYVVPTLARQAANAVGKAIFRL